MQKTDFRRSGPSKSNWSRPLADLIGQAIDPVLARQGFGQSSIILYWEDIVGTRIAGAAQPLKLQWPPRGKTANPDRRIEPATLVVRVESGFALELQHLAPVILERINAHLGWKCVNRLQLKQGPIVRAAKRREKPGDLSPAALAQAEQAVINIEEAPLRAALTRLGGRILSEQAQRTPQAGRLNET
jgi:hypothetical protein